MLASFAASHAAAQKAGSRFRDPHDDRFDASTFLVKNACGFLPVLIIITDPAVGGGLGMVGLFFHESEEQREHRLKALRESEDGVRYLLPPFATPGIVLRGIPAMRYQGNAVAVAEAEVAWQIDKRWSVSVFAGGGRAARDLDDLGDEPTRVARGGGFR